MVDGMAILGYDLVLGTHCIASWLYVVSVLDSHDDGGYHLIVIIAG